jgi:carboxyl-terminal processing protease
MYRRWIYGLMIGLVAWLSIAATSQYFDISRNLDVYAALYKDLNNYYVDDASPSKLMRTSIDAMLKTLDPFTNYYNESQIETYRMQNSEKLVGVGLRFMLVDSTPVIIDVVKDLPADKAGIKIGDKLTIIDGRATYGKLYDQISTALRGDANSNVKLTIQDPKGQTKEYTVSRKEFQETNVPYYGMLTEDIGCINLKIFNPDAGKDVRTAFDSLRTAYPAMKGLVLDLRGNPGGLLAEAVNVVNVFVDKNKLVVTTKGRVAEWNNSFKTTSEPADTRIPIVIITDNKSASASEIVAGCMQDYDRGVVLGQRSYGKGLVQITKNLSYNTMLKVTTARYFIPSGRCIQAHLYAEHNEDGSVKRIPDSLKHEFKTMGGRKVWDGGGIDPDVAMPKVEYDALATALIDQHSIFDYATQYTMAHPTLANAVGFQLTDADYQAFVAYVKHKDFKYKTETDKILERLKQVASEEKYAEALSEHYTLINKKVQAEKEQAFNKNRKQIQSLLENEIYGRYYYIKGKIKKSYENDALTSRAINLLHTPVEYNALLASHK